jgi:predicted phage tail component-like protein
LPLAVDQNGFLQPLGLYVTHDSRYDILPATRDYTEEVPGRHGEIDLGVGFRPRILELHCICLVEPSKRSQKIRDIANLLNPVRVGSQTLTFADEPEKVYYVRHSGQMEISPKSWGFEVVLPFKMFSPFITSAIQHQLIGTGTATNEGTVETPFLLLIEGSVTNPTVIVNGIEMKYTGGIEAGKWLRIDTDRMTAVLDELNALPNYNCVFPKLHPGDNSVVAADGGTTILRWHDRWI